MQGLQFKPIVHWPSPLLLQSKKSIVKCWNKWM